MSRKHRDPGRGVDLPAALLTTQVDRCVDCGLCLASCPTYHLWGEEADSPRGRIQLVRLVLEGKGKLNDEFRRRFDNCLGCSSCVAACPTGVAYDELLAATRVELDTRLPRDPKDRWFRKLLMALVPSRTGLRWAAIFVWALSMTGIPALLKAVFQRLRGPSRWNALFSLLARGASPRLRLDRPDSSSTVPPTRPAPWPSPSSTAPPTRPAPWPSPSSTAPPTRPAPSPSPSTPNGQPDPDGGSSSSGLQSQVSVFESCLESVFRPQLRTAALKVLRSEGVDVVEVLDSGCCGALEHHEGAHARAERRLARLLEDAKRVGPRLLAAAPRCGARLGKRVSGPPEDDVSDLLQYLGGLEPRGVLEPLPVRVAYHEACSRAHSQALRVAPIALLARIPRLELFPLAPDFGCCGAPGLYPWLNPGAAEALGQKAATALEALAPDVVAAADPTCLLHIQRFLSSKLRCAHPIELLAEALPPPKESVRP